MLVDLFLSYFGYELDFKTFFWGAKKLWHSPQVSCWPRFFCSILNHVLSTIFQSYFFFFQVLLAKLWQSPQVSCWARFFSQVLLAKLWHLPQVSCWPRFFSQVLSAKLWHSPQVSCWPRFFCSVLNHVHSTIFQSEEFFKVFFFSIFNCVFFNSIPVIKFCRPSCGTH